MTKERSAGAVVFRREDGAIKYLLLHYVTKSHHWDFPKGHLEKGETAEATAKREITEETAITDVQLLPGFSAEIAYYFMDGETTVFKEVIFFAAETKTGEVKISKEHIGFRWVSYETALKQLTYDNAKDVLRKAHVFLSR